MSTIIYTFVVIVFFLEFIHKYYEGNMFMQRLFALVNTPLVGVQYKNILYDNKYSNVY